MLKKLLILVMLVIVVVAVSYYKTMLSENDRLTAFNSGQTAAREDIGLQQIRSDSLITDLTQQNVTLTEAQALQQVLLVAQKDSMKAVIDAQQDLITSMEAVNKRLAIAPANKKVTKKKTESVDQEHLKILAYYKKKCGELPTDLSPYELRVSLSEIRQVSAKKFSITVVKLNQIRKANGLNY